MKQFIFILLIMISSLHTFETREGDIILENFEPPETYWQVSGGSCGEACLWTVARFHKMEISQKEINKLAKAPGRGIYSKEVLPVLKKLKIPHKEISTIVSDYTSFIHKIIITKLKNGTPIFLGVKVYPDESPNWAVDHFILVVGYNELTEELIVNSDNARERVKFSKLLNTENGLSLVHKSRYVYAIEFGVK